MHLHPNRRRKVVQISAPARLVQNSFANTVEFMRGTAQVGISVFIIFLLSFGIFVYVAGGPQMASASPMQTVSNAKKVLISVYKHQNCTDCPPRHFRANIVTRPNHSISESHYMARKAADGKTQLASDHVNKKRKRPSGSMAVLSSIRSSL